MEALILFSLPLFFFTTKCKRKKRDVGCLGEKSTKEGPGIEKRDALGRWTKVILVYLPVKYESVHSTRWRKHFARNRERKGPRTGNNETASVRRAFPTLQPSCPEEIFQRKATILSRRPLSRLNFPIPSSEIVTVLAHLHAAFPTFFALISESRLLFSAVGNEKY